jgi:hypothetical protein
LEGVIHRRLRVRIKPERVDHQDGAWRLVHIPSLGTHALLLASTGTKLLVRQGRSCYLTSEI